METTSKTYNGWTNYETWAVKLWMDNNEGSYRNGCEQAQQAWEDAEDDGDNDFTREERAVYLLEDRLKEEYEQAKDAILETAKMSASVWADMLGAALSEVNWREIAENMLEEVDKNE
jgi:hypothetical protein